MANSRWPAAISLLRLAGRRHEICCHRWLAVIGARLLTQACCAQRLTRLEWVAIRAALGKPRRLSLAFLHEVPAFSVALCFHCCLPLACLTAALLAAGLAPGTGLQAACMRGTPAHDAGLRVSSLLMTAHEQAAHTQGPEP